MPVNPNGAVQEPAASSRPGRPRGPRRRRWVLAAGAVGLPVLAFVLWWFQPQALLFDNVVDEGFPVSANPSDGDGPAGESARPGPDDGENPDSAVPGLGSENAGTDGSAPMDEPESAPAGPVELAMGSFVSRNRYTVTGTATTYQLEDGPRVLRLQDFESTNGPDLYVYLTVGGAADDDAALDAEFVDLGRLSGNLGNQNYVIPDEVDLDRYSSVAIWCRRFTTSFGVADLTSG